MAAGTAALVASPELAVLADAASAALAQSPRAAATHALIAACGILPHIDVVAPRAASRADLATFHAPEFIDALVTAEHLPADSPHRHALVEEFGLIDDCPVFPGLAKYASLVAGASITAADCLVSRSHSVAICWEGGRHHAKRDEVAGFCYVNDIVLAIMHLLAEFDRVLYIDIDVHHGDGVERAFAASPRVLTLSFHTYEPGFFPGTGSLDSTGIGAGANHSINVPLRSGLSGPSLLTAFNQIVPAAIKAFNPNAIVMQCGTDGLARDPLAQSWNLDLASFTECVGRVTATGIPTLLLGGGGYSHTTAARCWTVCTAIAAKITLPESITETIPDHPFLADYAPDYSMHVHSGLMRDRNLDKDRHLDLVIQSVLNKIDMLANKTPTQHQS